MPLPAIFDDLDGDLGGVPIEFVEHYDAQWPS